MSVDSFSAKDSLEVGGTSYDYFRLDQVVGEGLDVASLPFSQELCAASIRLSTSFTEISSPVLTIRGPCNCIWP